MSTTQCSATDQQLLVVYTQNAASGRDIDGIISLAIQEANESYLNSNVRNMNVVLAHSQQINFNESNDIDTDLTDFINNNMVQNLRNQHQADVVLLITDGNYGSVAGVADAILATESSAYAIVEAEYSGGPDYTFAHELGHLQGAQHHPDDPTDPNGPFSYGYGHRFSYKASIFVPRRYRSTIMAYPCRPAYQDPYCSQVYSGRKHFSNPYVEYRGTDTGIQGSRENWLVLRNTASTIANFRNPDELQASINILNSNNQTGDYSFSASTCGDQLSLSYEWRVSLNTPFSYGSVLGTGSNFNYTFPPGEHYIKLTVSSGSESSVAYTSVVVQDEDCQDGDPCGPGGSFKTNPETEKSLVTEFEEAYPNPFNPVTNISFTLEKSEQVDLSVFTILGHKVASIVNNRLETGSYEYAFDARAFSSGVYILRFQAGNTVKTQQITLIK
ncbi:M12 family metallo-peptidase [Gracilimonas halophila]|uniref:M12 family metallo-peptidase n=1 Tax=Gracilimonas halophila TaxID=1834464 RepID=A0ABW5JMV4_9BACT